MKKVSIENLDDFLRTAENILKNKRRLANISKWKLSISKQNSRTIIINTLNNSSKEKLQILTLAPTFEKDIKNIIMIDTDVYHLAC